MHEGQVKRKKPKRADYILAISRNFPLAVVEAKAEYKKPADGLQQAKAYAEMLHLRFAYSTNGKGIVEHDYITGLERELDTFPSPEELWARYKSAEGIRPSVEGTLLEPFNKVPGKRTRYYQEIAINRAVRAILEGKERVLLTLATGTGKTYVAYQIIWKLWNAKWNRKGEPRRPRVLYLADRNVLVDDPKDKLFTSFGDARWKISQNVVKSREIYFSTYQAIAKDETRPGLYREYSPDFFDLVIVDECHRGSAKDESNWREILEHFKNSVQLGMTATPMRDDNIDTYRYFGNPLYSYSLKQGIEDGFLAPYRVHRIAISVDVTGWRPHRGQLDRYGREIPDGEYGVKDFERTVSLRDRTEAVAKHLSDFLKSTYRFAKTIVFCVDQEHAEQMRMALNNQNADLVKEHPDYVARIVADEGQVGRGHLDRFMDVEVATPVIVTTSRLLSTGVDVPTCRNIVIFRVVDSMTEFKQIIGRGTRVRDDYGKLYFNILDYTGSATKQFADSEFDGEPAVITEEEMNAAGNVTKTSTTQAEEAPPDEDDAHVDLGSDAGEVRKYYVDGLNVEIVASVVYELDSEGKRQRVVEYSDYARERVRSIYTSAARLREQWSDAEQRRLIIKNLEDKGVFFDDLARVAGQPEADPFDLLCHVAFNGPLRTRRERAEMVRKNQRDFFEQYGELARTILNEVLDKYVEFGLPQLDNVEILKVPPISRHGNIVEIAGAFGGVDELSRALGQLQNIVYAEA